MIRFKEITGLTDLAALKKAAKLLLMSYFHTFLFLLFPLILLLVFGGVQIKSTNTFLLDNCLLEDFEDVTWLDLVTINQQGQLIVEYSQEKNLFSLANSVRQNDNLTSIVQDINSKKCFIIKADKKQSLSYRFSETLLLSLIAIGSSIYAFFLYYKSSYDHIFISRIRAKGTIYAIFASLLYFSIVTYIYSRIVYPNHSADLNYEFNSAWLILLACLFIPLIEEFFFRRVLLQKWIDKGLGFLGVLFTSIIFAGIHSLVPLPISALFVFAVIFFFSIICSHLYINYGLFQSIVFHSIYNSLIVMSVSFSIS